MQQNMVIRLSVMFAKKWYNDIRPGKTHTLDAYIEQNVNKYIEIANAVNKYEQELVDFQKEVNIKKEILRKQQVELWSRCDHPVTSYHPDPSGNNDSYHECEICGKEI